MSVGQWDSKINIKAIRLAPYSTGFYGKRLGLHIYMVKQLVLESRNKVLFIWKFLIVTT